jgi:sRNA-binding protein
MTTCRQLMFDKLPVILKCQLEELPAVFRPVPGRQSRPGHRSLNRPLKVGIHNDLIGRFPEADKPALLKWTRWWCSSRGYVEVIARGGDRYDLDGNPAGTITDADIKHAKKRITPKAPKPAVVHAAPKVGTTRSILTLGKRAVVRASTTAVKKESKVERSIRTAVSESADRNYIERVLRRARR